MDRYIVALDQGTSSCRAVVYTADLTPVSAAQREFKQHYPQPGWVEHDPVEIFATQYSVMAQAIAQSGARPAQIAAIGITNQRETTVVWDKETGRPVYNAIVWQCRRTAPMVAELVEEGLGPYIQKTTGLVPDAYFSGTKVAWILENVEGARQKAEEGKLLFGTVDSWLLWKLTGGKVHATDHSNASRTMLYDIANQRWDEKLCQRLGIPMDMLPKVQPSASLFGATSYFGTEIPIAGIAGDQQAALFGQGCITEGQAKNTYGTGCFLLMHTGERCVESKHGLLTTLAASTGQRAPYALEGSVFMGGAIIQWLRDEMQFIETSAESEGIAAALTDNGGVYLVPAFTGLGAPHWDMYARGSLFGLTRGSGRKEIVRAALESIAYQTMDVLRAMEQDTGQTIPELRCDGGASANEFLMQFQANMLGAPVLRPPYLETTARGAAALAGLSAGLFENAEAVLQNAGQWATYSPNMEPALREKYKAGWQQAVRRTLGWGKETSATKPETEN